MSALELARRIEAPAERVWTIISTDEVINVFVGLYADKAEFQGEGSDAVLTTTLSNDEGTLRERVEHVDHDGRCLKYRMLDVGPYPYANYSGEMRVTESGPDACNVSFQCQFVPVGSKDAAEQFWIDHNNGVLERLSDYVKK